MITDTYYTAPISQSAHLHSYTGSRTFLYVNNYNFSAQRQNTPEASEKAFPDWVGACHECDLYLLFGFAFMPRELLPKPFNNLTWFDVDRNASQLFSSFFHQFIKYSDPNLPYDGSWFAHQPRAHWYMSFNYTSGDSLKIPGILKRDYKYQEVAFWNYYIPSVILFFFSRNDISKLSW